VELLLHHVQLIFKQCCLVLKGMLMPVVLILLISDGVITVLLMAHGVNMATNIMSTSNITGGDEHRTLVTWWEGGGGWQGLGMDRRQG
jgi:hypothetical protein